MCLRAYLSTYKVHTRTEVFQSLTILTQCHGHKKIYQKQVSVYPSLPSSIKLFIVCSFYVNLYLRVYITEKINEFKFRSFKASSLINTKKFKVDSKIEMTPFLVKISIWIHQQKNERCPKSKSPLTIMMIIVVDGIAQ